jgi:hypothetical protein
LGAGDRAADPALRFCGVAVLPNYATAYTNSSVTPQVRSPRSPDRAFLHGCAHPAALYRRFGAALTWALRWAVCPSLRTCGYILKCARNSRFAVLRWQAIAGWLALSADHFSDGSREGEGAIARCEPSEAHYSVGLGR